MYGYEPSSAARFLQTTPKPMFKSQRLTSHQLCSIHQQTCRPFICCLRYNRYSRRSLFFGKFFSRDILIYQGAPARIMGYNKQRSGGITRGWPPRKALLISSTLINPSAARGVEQTRIQVVDTKSYNAWSARTLFVEIESLSAKSRPFST